MMGTSLLVSTGIGGSIGFFIDYLAGTSPWFLLLFLFMGFAAGIRSVISDANDYRQRIEDRDAEA